MKYTNVGRLGDTDEKRLITGKKGFAVEGKGVGAGGKYWERTKGKGGSNAKYDKAWGLSLKWKGRGKGLKNTKYIKSLKRN